VEPQPEKALDVRKGQITQGLSRDEFQARFQARFFDPAFKNEATAIARLEEIAWDAYQQSRKSPVTRTAGAGFADSDYPLAVDWLEARDRIQAAQRQQSSAASASRVLLVCGASRNDYTCPGEMSKSWRLAQIARQRLQTDGMEVDLLDLSRLASDPQLHIHPCKACVSTAMPLCNWPCSCYPNYALGQVNDWMNDIYPRWVACHGVLIVTPVYWYQVASPLKLMIDRLVCADGGNPDPTLTQGKNPAKAKAVEMAGWDYPQHLADRVYGVVVHGDVAGIEEVRRALSDWLDWMGLIASGQQSRLDRFIGYYEPYATSHQALDRDTAVQEEVGNVAAAVARSVSLLRAGKLARPDRDLKRPRPK
jgi:multimeric flavodoxin WrbA